MLNFFKIFRQIYPDLDKSMHTNAYCALSQHILGCVNSNIFSGEYIQTFDVCYASKVA